MMPRLILIGALIYVPLCLFEIKMSPQLHKLVYGFQQHAFYQTKRFGGYRPMVFMQHGIMVALWMAAGTLMALGMMPDRKRIGGVPMGWIVAGLFVVTLLCKSVGAMFLLIVGMGVVLWMRNRRSAVPLRSRSRRARARRGRWRAPQPGRGHRRLAPRRT